MAGPNPQRSMRDLPFGSLDCFACGRSNAGGLHMRFRTDGRRLYSDVTIPPHLRGWSNLAHGGILSTMLDEIMAWSAMYLTHRFILTKWMRVEFLRPVRIETTLTAIGEVKSRPGDRSAIMAAEILDPAGEACARAEGEYALFDRESFARLDILPARTLEELANLLDSAEPPAGKGDSHAR